MSLKAKQTDNTMTEPIRKGLSPSQLVVPADLRPEDAADFAQLLLATKANAWDYFVCTDGSGSTPDKPGGYGAVILSRRSTTPVLLAGSLNRCTSQQAEIRGVFETVNHLVNLKAGEKANGAQVYVITDSQYVADKLPAIIKEPASMFTTGKHAVVWAGIMHARRVGIVLHVRYVARNSNPLMTMADRLSKEARAAVLGVDTEMLAQTLLQQCEQSFSLTTSRTPRRPQR